MSEFCYLSPSFLENDVRQVSILGLAYIGDCVFELLVRTYLISQGHTASLDLHRSAVAVVNAPAQNRFFEKISSILTEEEYAVYRRGRNAKVNSVPHNATAAEYHSATGLEAVFGWLYLLGKKERIEELFAAGFRKIKDIDSDE